MTTIAVLVSYLWNAGFFPPQSSLPCVTRMVVEHVAVLDALRNCPEISVRITVFDDDFAPDTSVTGNVRINVKPTTMAIFPEVCIASFTFCVVQTHKWHEPAATPELCKSWAEMLSPRAAPQRRGFSQRKVRLVQLLQTTCLLYGQKIPSSIPFG